MPQRSHRSCARLARHAIAPGDGTEDRQQQQWNQRHCAKRGDRGGAQYGLPLFRCECCPLFDTTRRFNFGAIEQSAQLWQHKLHGQAAGKTGRAHEQCAAVGKPLRNKSWKRYVVADCGARRWNR